MPDPVTESWNLRVHGDDVSNYRLLVRFATSGGLSEADCLWIGDPVGIAAVHPVALFRRGRYEKSRLPLGGVRRRDGEEERATSRVLSPLFAFLFFSRAHP